MMKTKMRKRQQKHTLAARVAVFTLLAVVQAQPGMAEIPSGSSSVPTLIPRSPRIEIQAGGQWTHTGHTGQSESGTPGYSFRFGARGPLVGLLGNGRDSISIGAVDLQATGRVNGEVSSPHWKEIQITGPRVSLLQLSSYDAGSPDITGESPDEFGEVAFASAELNFHRDRRLDLSGYADTDFVRARGRTVVNEGAQELILCGDLKLGTAGWAEEIQERSNVLTLGASLDLCAKTPLGEKIGVLGLSVSGQMKGGGSEKENWRTELKEGSIAVRLEKVNRLPLFVDISHQTGRSELKQEGPAKPETTVRTYQQTTVSVGAVFN